MFDCIDEGADAFYFDLGTVARPQCKLPRWNDPCADQQALQSNLTTTIHAEEIAQDHASKHYHPLREKVGRFIWNGFPIGVAVVLDMEHGGPYPATIAFAGTASVGMTAIRHFMRPVAYQNMLDALLSDALKDANPLNLWRLVN